MSEDLPLQERLEAYYQRGDDKAFHVSNLTPIGNGWETEVYSFTLTLRRRRSDEMVLRMYPGANAAETCRREFRGMKGIYLLGYPVPYVTVSETDSQWLGKPFILMPRIAGRPLGDVMREDLARQPELLIRFVQLLVNLHHTNYRQIADPLNLQEAFSWLPTLLAHRREVIVAENRQVWASHILDWLDASAANVNVTNAWSPLHGDFHPNNVLITPDDKLYVIDWSGFALGDYRVDLAWTLMLISTMGYPELRPLILREYERISGHAVENIEYFDVIAALKRLSEMVVSLTSGAESLGMRPETVEIMRRQHDHYQQVYALLQQITGLNLLEIERLIDSLQA